MAIQLRPRSRAIPVVFGLVLAACSVLPAIAASSSLKPLVVQNSDVTNSFGSGFRVLTQRAMTPTDVQGLQAGTTKGGMNLLLKGWVKGYFSSFYRPAAKSGPSVLTSGVSLYSDSSYPRSAMDSTMKSKGTILGQLRKVGVTSAQITWLTGVGDKALLMKYSLAIPGSTTAPTSAFVVLWSRGHFAETLSVSGHGGVSRSQVVSLAQRLDSRLQHAG